MDLFWIQKLFWPREVTDFLHRDIIRTDYIILNGWSFLHMLWGVILAITFKFLSRWIYFSPIVALNILIIFEAAEYFLFKRGVIIGDKNKNFFLDSLWDIIFGWGAFLIVRGLLW